MNIVVVYDSVYGNTDKIAHAIGEGLSDAGEVRVIKAEEASEIYVRSVSVIVVGSPTHGGRPTPAVQKFMDSIEEHDGEGTYYAAFDTRFDYKDQNVGLRFLMRMIGYGADKIDARLSGIGGNRLINCEGFIVEGRDGPLRDGEIQRAKQWGSSILNEYLKRSREEITA